MNEIDNILYVLEEQRGFDFSGYRKSMIERRVQKRVFATKNKDISDYLEYINRVPEELDKLIDVFTINVSRFFRNSLIFEYVSKIIIPDLIQIKAKENSNNKNIRIWSAGCSYGEEPYSMAIILNELISKEKFNFRTDIFATDMDKKAIKKAIAGVYGYDSIKNIKFGILQKYFNLDKDEYKINSEIKKMIQFSFYDLLDKKRMAPPDSIFGGFDIVLCRNVLIYLEPEYQKIIFNKLFKSLNKNGYLLLGDAEVPIEGYKHKFKRVNNCCKIYRKLG